MKQIAILGATASGKTALSLELASKHNAIILSLDSLSIYKEIDIASAKPTKEERGDIVHFGIDEIYPDEYFSSALFFTLYEKAKSYAKKHEKNLIIVGGTSFYLKSLKDGLSLFPKIDERIKKEAQSIANDPNDAYRLIQKLDEQYAKNISSSDRYRIGKWYEIYLSSKTTATEYFKKHKKESPAKDIKIYEIAIQRDELRQRIKIRTDKMIQEGLIDEVFYLEKRYTRAPKSMKSIGIKETLEYLDGKLSIPELSEKISIATSQLAKRQNTFNKTQFDNITKEDLKTLKDSIDKDLSR